MSLLTSTISFWGPLQSSIQRNKMIDQTRYVQFATVSSDNLPAVRTLEFLGFHGQEALLFDTDIRSKKVADLTANPVAEICWYFPLTKEQFRIRGKVSIVTAESKEESLLAERCVHLLYVAILSTMFVHSQSEVLEGDACHEPTLVRASTTWRPKVQGPAR